MVLEQGRAAQRRQAKKGRRLSVVGVLGEVLITAGVLVLLFLGWQTWFNDMVLGSSQQDQAAGLTSSWQAAAESASPTATPGPTASAATTPVDPGEPVVAVAPGNAEDFAVLMVPRFGADWTRPIAEGIGVEDVLNQHAIGHYPGTSMPGEVGNAAFAAHRTGWGSPFIDINTLVVGNSIYVETEDGWYRYVFRSLEYVDPSGVGVLDPVPQQDGVAPVDRIITLTSCNPLHSVSERIIAYGVFDTWFPRSGGAPAEIAKLVQASAAS